jgi:mannose-6-phosphate isomerase
MHALGKGIFAVEVGSLGNTTYRICDWGRGRQLHVDKAFDVLKTGNRPSVTDMGTYGEQVQPRERLGVDAGFFKSFVLDVDGSQSFRCDRRYAVITCVGGAARVSTTNGSVELGYTDSCLVPAAASTYTISGTCRVLRSVRTPDTPEEA